MAAAGAGLVAVAVVLEVAVGVVAELAGVEIGALGLAGSGTVTGVAAAGAAWATLTGAEVLAVRVELLDEPAAGLAPKFGVCKSSADSGEASGGAGELLVWPKETETAARKSVVPQRSL